MRSFLCLVAVLSTTGCLLWDSGSQSSVNGLDGGSLGGSGGGCGGAATSSCAGVSLEASGALDLEVKRLALSGRVTLNGGPLPDVAAGRGRLVFERADIGEAVRVPLRSSGGSAYAVSVSPGEYLVAYEPQDAANWRATSDGCAAPGLAAMPCVGGLLQRVTVSTSGALDLDLQTVQMTGRVTVNGAMPPDAPGNRGVVLFALAGGGLARSQPFGNAGAVSWAVHLLKGRYAVSYDSQQRPCARDWPMPCNQGAVLLGGQELQASGVLDLDLPAVQLRGVLRQNGQALPWAAQSGQLEFTRRGESPFLTAPFASGAADYSLWLLKGRYTTVYRAASANCDGLTAADLTCAGAPVAGCP